MNALSTRRGLGLVLLAAVTFLATPVVTGLGSTANAAPCSTTTGASSCTVNTSTTVTAGTLTLEHSPNLYWNVVGTGYDQFTSGSSTALSGCAASGSATTCSGGTAPKLIVLDASGSNSGWALSAYVTASNLPSGSVLSFNGNGAGTVGNSTASPIGTNPYSASTPTAVCDFGSSCTVPTAATGATCSHAPLGFSTCPTYGVNLLAGTSATAQVDLYSAAATSGMGASCFGTGTATATGCVGTVSDAFYNLGVKGNATAGVYTGAVINLSVTSGP